MALPAYPAVVMGSVRQRMPLFTAIQTAWCFAGELIAEPRDIAWWLSGGSSPLAERNDHFRDSLSFLAAT